MNARLALLALLLLPAACIPAREPARQLGGEMSYLGAYVGARAGACEPRTFELAMAPRPNTVIETLPPTYESGWELRVCGDALRFTLDCRLVGETWACGSHEWPTPLRPEDYAFAHELEAVARRAPACPPERSCVTQHTCKENSMVLRRLPRDRSDDYARYEVARCGIVAAVNVRCTREAPFQCVTTSSAPIDMLDPTHGEPGRRPTLPP